MRAVSLLYHDVIPGDLSLDYSGFAGKGPGHYKLRLPEFERHLNSIARIRPSTIRITELAASKPLPLLLTFDDGGSSGYELIAPALERFGWRGHFFITTDYINRPGFATAHQIRELQERGHIIGSHSASHPLRMSSLSPVQLRAEWSNSISVLQELLGSPVTVASVPGGGFSKKVAIAAAEAGIRSLFTSEPVTRCTEIEGCMVVGRYSIWSDTSAEEASNLAGKRTLPTLRQFVGWNAKKLFKAALGNQYLSIRDFVFRHKPVD